MTYQEALAVLEGRKEFGYARKLKTPNPNRERVKVANNTYIELVSRPMHWIALRLHDTRVVVWTPRWAELTSGGYPTMTTADRLRMGPCSVYSTKNGWHVFTRSLQDCYCVTNDHVPTVTEGERKPGLAPRFTDRWTGEPYDNDNGSLPIYEWATCQHCQGSGKYVRGDDNGGYLFYDGIRVRNDGTGILKTQSNKPERFEPIYTRSGFSDSYGFAASRMTY